MTPTARDRRTARWLMPARMGWLAVAALVLGLDALAVPYFYLRDRAAFTSDLLQALLHAHPALRIPTEILDYAGQVCFVAFLYVFPDGRFVPRWTRWLVLTGALLWLPSVFFGMSLTGVVYGPAFFGLLGTIVVAQVYRYRNVSGPAQRRQTRWVVYGVVVALVGFSVAVLIDVFVPLVGHSGLLVRMVVGALVNAFIVLIPLSIGVAMVRSGLYDVDVIINRTLVYASLTVSLAAAYFGSIVALQYVVRALTGAATQLAVVASTLLIAALFNPLRRRIQSFIDRRFYRKKYDARKTLEAFSARLRDETDLEALRGELVWVVRETVSRLPVVTPRDSPAARPGRLGENSVHRSGWK